ncbi:hypothetical protein BDD12DRAFT_871615 [Trichophaea hybrida]|nr:hypothetical protein BDD12DRAFT_871615 [Trichophaea hybrida]
MPITTAAPTPQPAGQQQQQHNHHRRIHSLKTTLNFFKASKTLSHDSPVRRRELTISTPINNTVPLTIREDLDAGISPTEPRPAPTPTPTPTTPLSRSGTERPIFDSQSYSSRFHSTASFEGTGRRRGGTPLGRGSELNGGATDINDSGQMNPRTRSPVPSGTSDVEHSSNDKQSSTASGGGKKTAAKLRMALSLLSRRRSNPNLRKAYVAPVDENSATRESWGPFNTQILSKLAVFSPSVTAVPVRRSSTIKSSGFKFTLPARGSSRTVLSKPQRDNQPRRATVASVILGDETQLNNGWDGIGARPRSSQSTLPGELTVPDEPGDDCLFSRESAALGAPSPGQGGLFPRPASLQRHWSDGAQKKIEEADPNSTSERASQPRQNTDPDRVRPLSFGGLSNGFGSLKITEAAALESRVKELETQVSDLRSIIAESTHWSPRSFDESVLTHSNGFNVSPGTSFSRPNSDTAVAPEESLRYEQVSPRGSVATRERTLSVLEGLHFDSENKRSTLSTIRAPRRGSTSVSENSPQSVNMAEYTGIVAMVKREQKARRRLEQQVAALQEQMAAVLHRQLIADSTQSRSPLLENVSPRRRHHHHPDFNALHRKASSEVPTPDITPPPSSSSNAAQRQSANLFTSFDSGGASPSSDDGHSTVNNFYDASRTHSDAWQTPSEEKENMLERTDSVSTFGETLLDFPPPGGGSRTLSLSQLTLKSSTRLAQRV